jgi:hypothetical protein
MLPKLRANSIMPRLVNRDFDTLAAQPGSSIDVPIPPTITTAAVTAANTPPATADMTLSTVNVPLSSWNEAPFYMTDKDMLEVQQDKLPGVVEAALASIVSTIDADILTAADAGCGLADDQGTGIFAAIGDVIEPGTLLNRNKVARAARSCVFDSTAEAALLALTQFTSADYQTSFPMETGMVGPEPKLGMQWWMDQNVQTHTCGTGNGYLVNASEGYVIGDKVITVDTGTGTMLAGDVVTIGSYNYGVASLSGTTLTLNQGLLATVANNATITLIDRTSTHTANIAMARDAIVFCSRPFQSSNSAIASQTISDPVSGLSLRLEVTREHKRDRWSIDCLYGTKVVRPEGVIKIIG